jgi:hypothetical protein
MTTLIGFYLSGGIALGIIFIGARFLFAPHEAAAGFGVAVAPDARWDAYLSVKGVRDIASGLFIAILIFNRSTQLLGWFMLAATIIPVTDAAIVLRHGGTKAAAFGIHGVTAGVMLIISALLLL